MLASCGPRADFFGKWDGHRAMAPRPGVPSYVLFSASQVLLYIYPSGRFDLKDLSVPKSGTIAVDGMHAVLTVTKIANIDVNEQSEATKANIGPIYLDMQPDGSIRYRDPKAMDASEVKLLRVATGVKDRP